MENVFGDARPTETVQVMISSPRFGDPSQVSLEPGMVDDFKNVKDPEGDFNHPSFSTDGQASAENCSSVAIANRTTDYGVDKVDNKASSNLQAVSVPPSSEWNESIINVTKPSDSNKHEDEYKIAQIEDPSLSDAWTKAKQGHPG